MLVAVVTTVGEGRNALKRFQGLVRPAQPRAPYNATEELVITTLQLFAARREERGESRGAFALQLR